MFANKKELAYAETFNSIFQWSEILNDELPLVDGGVVTSTGIDFANLVSNYRMIYSHIDTATFTVTNTGRIRFKIRIGNSTDSNEEYAIGAYNETHDTTGLNNINIDAYALIIPTLKLDIGYQTAVICNDGFCWINYGLDSVFRYIYTVVESGRGQGNISSGSVKLRMHGAKLVV